MCVCECVSVSVYMAASHLRPLLVSAAAARVRAAQVG